MKKKYIFSVVLSLVLLLIINVTITTALLRIKTNSKRNGVAVGEGISIQLVETEWDKLIEDGKTVYVSPSQQISKDPKVKNTSSECNVYAYLQVKVPRAEIRLFEENAKTLEDPDTILEKQWTDLFTYSINDGWILVQSEKGGDGDVYSTYIYAYTSPVTPNDSTVTLFDKVVFTDMLEGEIESDTVENIQVTAMAIQADYMELNGDTETEKFLNGYTLYLRDKS